MNLVQRLRVAAPIGLTAAHVSDLQALRDAADELERLQMEIEVLRSYGNKDCTAMADDALEQKRLTGKGPWED